MIVAGVDGARAGWVAVVFPAGRPEQAALHLLPRLADLFSLLSPPACVAVDMPIGLPERVGPGGRRAEIEVRALIGARRASVFAIPSRAAVYSADYASARIAALATSDPPRSIAKQAFNIFSKIREVDWLLQARPELAERLHECHPEASFCLMLGLPLASPKKRPAGAAQRLALLEAAGFSPTFLQAKPPRGAAADDVLDACAAAWTAGRIAGGQSRRFPSWTETDALGLQMVIRA